MKSILVLAAALFVLNTTGFAQKPVVVGICPFYDDTGTEAGERSGTLLPVMFLEKGKSAGFVPLIVNPGPEAIPGDTQWPMEVARAAGADAVLIGQIHALATVKGRRPTDEVLRGHVLFSSQAANLVLSAVLVDTADGRELAHLNAQEMVKGSWLSEAAARLPVIGFALHRESFWFAETHFGQAIARAAEKLISGIGSPLSQVTPRRAYAPVSAGQTCHVTVHVIYKAKDRSSKMYLAAVNGKEESMGIKDGLLELEVPSGPILLHITVKDPPYRQPVQSTYYANSVLDCSRADSSLAFEIGAAGEGVIHWR